MPTLPLYAQTPTSAGPEGWHRVQSPGGYEVWRFVACDVASALWVMASLSWGSTVHPDYLRQYARYRRKPTRHAPPIPRDFCHASFALYESGKQSVRFDAPLNGNDFSVAPGELGVSDQAKLTVDSGGHFHLHLSGRDPLDRTVTARLLFDPLPAPPVPEIESLDKETPVHHWSLTQPICNVNGEVTILQGPASALAAVKFNGRGCHDHIWRIRPLACDFASSFGGYILDDKKTFCFEHLYPRSGSPLARCFEIDATNARNVQAHAELGGWRRARFNGARFPRHVRFDDLLTLQNPRLLATSALDLHLTYDAQWTTGHGVAICRVIDWKRLAC